MGLVRCPNGHVYNARRYGKLCPYCNMKLSEEEEEKMPAGFEPPVEILEEEVEPVCGWLVPVSGDRLPPHGPDQSVPERRGLRFPGPAPGRGRAAVHLAGAYKGTAAAVRLPAV